ncbi:acyltransferase [Escherichia fergusonii]|uniref:acyltransferase family protein n=1 Tax=Escherichia fergusonii TaxID=564 RepID=UPI0017E1C179|nr:acyltransferase [Escherichia fergusonii]HCO5013092.1 acyltransferase [Escherichia fergusonii]
MINTIQALRFFAAFFVVLHHGYRSFPVEYFGELGNVIKINFAFGVDIFFVISGYVIYSSFMSKPKSAWKFISDRIIRIVPIYWLYTMLFLVVTLNFTTPFTSNVYEINNLLSSLFFIPSTNPAGGLFPTLTVGWTLNFEMVFYMIFFFSILIKSKNIAAFLLISIVVLNSLSSIGITNYFYADAVIYEFSLGVIIGYLHRNSDILNSRAIFAPSALILVMFTLMCTTDENQRVIAWGIPSAIIVACCISINDKACVPKFILLLGNSSYSLYLVHKVILSAIIYPVIGGYLSFSNAFLLSIVLSVVLSVLSYKFIELPITKTIKSIYIKNDKVPV